MHWYARPPCTSSSCACMSFHSANSASQVTLGHEKACRDATTGPLAACARKTWFSSTDRRPKHTAHIGQMNARRIPCAARTCFSSVPAVLNPIGHCSHRCGRPSCTRVMCRTRFSFDVSARPQSGIEHRKARMCSWRVAMWRLRFPRLPRISRPHIGHSMIVTGPRFLRNWRPQSLLRS